MTLRGDEINVIMGYEIIWIFFTMLFIILLYEQNSVFKYYAKNAVFMVGSLFFATVFIPVMLFKPGDYRNALLPAWGARMLSKLIGISWKIRGQENIIQDEGTVILMNHQSFLDLLALANIWPVFQRCTVISKKEIFYLWPFGLAAWLWGTVFIDRSSPKHAQEGVNKASNTITSKKAKICLFPEGTRHGGEKLKSFKKGAFHIAIESQAPIQPLVVKRYTFVDSKKCRFDEGLSVISILPAIPTKGLTKNDMNELIEKTYNAMSEEYTRLNSNE